MALKDKMTEEKRKFQRFECLIPSEVLSLGGKNRLIERAIIRDFSAEGLKLVIRFVNPVPGSRAKLILQIPEENLITPVSGEVRWSKYTENILNVGIKIDQIDPEAREEILSWILPSGLEKEKIKK